MKSERTPSGEFVPHNSKVDVTRNINDMSRRIPSPKFATMRQRTCYRSTFFSVFPCLLFISPHVTLFVLLSCIKCTACWCIIKWLTAPFTMFACIYQYNWEKSEEIERTKERKKGRGLSIWECIQQPLDGGLNIIPCSLETQMQMNHWKKKSSSGNAPKAFLSLL